MRKYLPFFLGFLALLSFFLVNASTNVALSIAEHIVISEVQLSGGTGASTKEFVELYNPTENPVSLQNWKFTKKNEAGSEETALIATLSGTIPAHGFFLIASEDYGVDATVSADILYSTQSASLTSDNTILIYNNLSELVDKLGLGDAMDFETEAETNASAGTSRERRANTSSTTSTMNIGGIDEFLGNGEDTDNNAVDFVLRSSPQPQNSSSAIEPVLAPTPTPTETSSPTATPEPTDSPTPTPTPLAEPTATPLPSETPTATPEPTEEPTSTSTPTPTPSGFFKFPGTNFSCRVSFSRGIIPFPRIRCFFR